MNKKIDKVAAYLTDVTAKGQLTGVQFGFSDQQQTVVLPFGKLSYDCDLPVSEMTLFDMASCSKVLATTTLILKLIQENRLHLDDKVKNYLPDYPYESTIEQLLTHTSGLPSDDKQYRNCANKQEMREFINRLTLVCQPSTEVVYSDFGYILLGFSIEELLGDLDEVSRREVFVPLAMNATGYRPMDHGFSRQQIAATELKEGRGVVWGSSHDGKAHILNDVSGNAGVFSNAGDVLHYANMLLGQDEVVLTNSTKALLHHSFTTGLNINRTLGWLKKDPICATGQYASEDSLFHTGFTGTSIYIDFQRQLAITLLTNACNPHRGNPYLKEVRDHVHDLLLGE